MTESRDWFVTYTPVVETPQEEDEFAYTLPVERKEEQQ